MVGLNLETQPFFTVAVELLENYQTMDATQKGITVCFEGNHAHNTVRLVGKSRRLFCLSMKDFGPCLASDGDSSMQNIQYRGLFDLKPSCR